MIQPTHPATQPTFDEDAPFQRCGRCGRTTYDPAEFDTEDHQTRPDGYPCGGSFLGNAADPA